MTPITYTERASRRFITHPEMDPAFLVPQLRKRNLYYMPDEEDRSRGRIVKPTGGLVATTEGDYPVVMDRVGFHAEVEWPTGLLGWVHGSQGALMVGTIIIFLTGLLLANQSQGWDAVGAVWVFAIPMAALAAILGWIRAGIVRRGGAAQF